jgi:1-acyl-sn-glycerol-3-phosphate acyltransferase
MTSVEPADGVTLPPKPGAAEAARLRQLMGPLIPISRPVFLGDEHVPAEGPALFVGNHTLYGIIDSPHLLLHLHDRHGRFPRTLGHHEHFSIPAWSKLVEVFGTVDGTRENCAALFLAGESVLVFPGGSREAFKRKGEDYSLQWGDRLGFARMALRHGVPIVPFAALGADEVWKIIKDGPELLDSPFLGAFLKGLRVPEDIVPPISRGRGFLGTPKLERLYFTFGPPVDTRAFGGREDDEAARAVREQVEARILAGLEQLKAHRAEDADRRLSDVLIRWVVPRVLGRIPGLHKDGQKKVP